MLRPIRHTRQLMMGWGCPACGNRETYCVEEVVEFYDGVTGTAANITPRPDLQACTKCGLLFMAEILAEKNS